MRFQVANTHKSMRIKIMHNIGILFVKMAQYSDACTSFEWIMAEQPDLLSQRSALIASYALCGFANFASIGIQIGGIGGIAPERRHDLAKLGMKSMLAGTAAALLTATVAGLLI